MLRSTLLRLPLLALASAAVLAAAGCGSDDDSTAPPPATTAASAPAAAASAAAPKLDPADAHTLAGIRQTVAQYCAGHKATAGELTGAIATLESLYEIDPDAAQADGTTVKQATTALEQRLRACGARSAAKRLGKLTG
jgi:polyisoprenoid-binding protein YceI